MKILVDTNIWSQALRRKADNERSDILRDLILFHQVVLIGPIRQELLSGVSNEDQFASLQSKLEAFDDFPVITRDYITAAQFYNRCRKHGIQGSQIDFLICAVAVNNNMLIYTNDKDFDYFSEYLPISRYKEHQ